MQELIDGLTENEKAMLGKDAVGKLDALAERLRRLEEEANSPKTGSVGDLTLWIALLFISGGIAAGALAVKKNKRMPSGNGRKAAGQSENTDCPVCGSYG